jgi:hypothetical protein
MPVHPCLLLLLLLAHYFPLARQLPGLPSPLLLLLVSKSLLQLLILLLQGLGLLLVLEIRLLL